MTTATATEHGSRACYLTGCRRPECCQAHHDYLAHRNRQVAYGRWDPFTDAEPVRQHLNRLAQAGITPAQAAGIAGVRPATVRDIVQGHKQGSPPSQRVRHDVADKILAVTPDATRQPRTQVDATGTHRRLQALMACGWTPAMLSAELGCETRNFPKIFVQPTVYDGTRRAVTEIYERLWNQAPPLTYPQTRVASRRACDEAMKNGWPPPMAWDDDQIDDPAGVPAEGWRRPRRMSSADRAAEIRELLSQGIPKRAVADRLKISRDSIDKILSRHPEVAA